MPASKSQLRLGPGNIALVIGLLFLYVAGVALQRYGHRNYLKYYSPFAQIEPGMSKAKVHELLRGWQRSQYGEWEARKGGAGDVEEYIIFLQYSSSGGPDVRVYYEDSLVVRKEAFSEGHKIFDERNALLEAQEYRRHIVWLTIASVCGSFGMVSCPFFWEKRRIATSDRERVVSTVVGIVGGLCACVGSMIVLGTVLLLGPVTLLF